MATSLIEWLRNPWDGSPGYVWNFLKGCAPVSEGCFRCYAVPQVNLRAGNPKVADQFAGLVHRTENGLEWTGEVNFIEHLLTAPLGWAKGQYVFVNSLSDLFYEKVSDEIIAHAFAIMLVTPQHMYIALTKRPGRMCSLLNSGEFRERVYEIAADYDRNGVIDPYRHAPDFMVSVDYELPDYPSDDSDWWPLENLILGVSAENQKWADVRIPLLVRTPAKHKAVSVEPMIGPVNLDRPGWLDPRDGGLDLVIVGGESGHNARAMHPGWARAVRDQVTGREGVSFFFKQWGEWGPAPFSVPVCDPKKGWQGTPEELEEAKAVSEAVGATHVHTGNPYPGGDGTTAYHVHKIDCGKPWSVERTGLTPPHEAIRRWGKRVAGRVLDGRIWDEMPAAPQPLTKP